MKTTGLRLLAFGLLLLLAADAAARQDARDPAAALESLRAAVAKFRAIDRDPNTPADIRAFNREILAEKEAQLRPLLEARRRQWRDYISDRAADLSEEQIRRAQASVVEIDAELRQMLTAGGSPETDAARPEGQPRAGQSQAERPETTPETTPADEGEDDSSPTGSSPGGQTASGPTAQTLDNALEFSARQIREARERDPNSGAARVDLVRRDYNLVAQMLLRQKAKAEAVTEAENARTDKQLEVNEAQSGTTSLVSKGGIPAVLGFATAYGALTRSEEGTTITFTLNPVGLASALAERGYITSFQTETPFERFLRNFALGFSFDASRGDTGGVFTGGPQQLSGLSVRYNIINRRDPRERRYTDDFVNLARTQGVPIAGDYARLIRRAFLNPTPSIAEWARKTDEALQRAAPGQEKRVLEEQLNKFPISDLPPEVDAIINSLARNLAGFRSARDELLKRVSSGLVLTLDYSLERRGDLPDLSNIRFIAEKGPYDGKIDLTFNSSVSFFHSRPTGANANRLRDFRFAGQIDVPLRETRWTGKPLLSFAGRYQRLLEDETLPNGGTLSAKGDIAVGQLKLTIPVRGTAFKIPLSLSFSNRTELLDEKEVRGNFGFTFDMDSVFARFNPFKP